MRRSALITAVVLGTLVCLLGGTVLYSALQDTARTGTNSVDSAALTASADIQLARGTFNAGNVDCGTFSEDLTSGLYTVTGVSPGYSALSEFVCIKNVGSQQVTLSALADELTDVDFACTGDEALHGDTTCGGDLAGELSNVLRVEYSTVTCQNTGGSGSSPFLKDNATIPHALGTLAAAATGCYSARILYPSTTVGTAVQTAQSDRATWRFKFTAQA
ncbi:MAG: hypothetical protein ACXWZB_00565 [Gaiellaceae bacterium]